MAMKVDKNSLAFSFFSKMDEDPGDRKNIDSANSKCFHLKLCRLYDTLAQIMSLNFRPNFIENLIVHSLV